MEALPAGPDDPVSLVIAGALLIGASGIPGLFLPAKTNWGQKCAALAVATGSLLGIIGALTALFTEQTSTLTLSGSLPFGPLEAGIDPLSAFFLLPVFIVAACCAVYGTGYWPAILHPRTAPRLTFFFGVLASSLALIPLARNGVL
ncbi:hydrogenase, partial [bacterium]|nr:hydrogenase [bacterium]